MKKLLSLLLCCVMVFSLPMEVFATSSGAKTVVFVSDGHGQYVVSNSRSAQDSITATVTSDEELYHVNGNQYLANVHGNTFLMMERIDINPNATSRSSQITSLPEQVQEELNRTIAEQKQFGNTDLEVSVYVPMSTLSNASQQTRIDEWDAYYEFQGIPFRDYWVKYWHCYAEADSSGNNAHAVADAFGGLVVSVVGVWSTTIGVFGAALSLLGVFEAACGPVQTGQTGDYAHALQTYDKLWKSTQRLDGAQNMLNSEKVWLDTLATTQLYGSVSGEIYQYQSYINQVYYTERYNASCEWIVYSTYSTADDPVTIVLLGTRYEL